MYVKNAQLLVFVPIFIMFIAGYVLVFAINKKLGKVTYIAASLAIVWAVAMLVLTAFEKIGLVLSTLFFGCGFVMIASGVSAILRTFHCTEKVSAIYIDNFMFSNKGFQKYKPVFEYRFNGQKYSSASLQAFSKMYIERFFKKCERYEIYISPKFPKRCVVLKRILFNDVFLIVFGIFTVLLSFFIFIVA